LIEAKRRRRRGAKIPRCDYQARGPVEAARFFLGKYLLVRTSRGISGGIIVETEAYGGCEDRACHGFDGRRTARTEIMFGPGGYAYVYLCYGLHWLLNFVTGPADSPEAVLIRGVKITEGKEAVAVRRKGLPETAWANGPGRVTAALGIGRKHNACDLTGETIWVEDRGLVVPPREVGSTPRIGISYAGEWAHKPWRFVWTPLS
jgi:DNA-3-methyladenine glycosylase